MATAPQPQAPNFGELAPPENPFDPLKRVGREAAVRYSEILTPTDSILASKGGAENLKIYRELLRDDQVAAVWGQRRLALTSCETTVTPGGGDNPSALDQAAADALKEDLDAILWDDVTDKALYSVFYGWGVAEIMWKPNAQKGRISFDKIVVRDRSRFRFGRSGELFLWTSGGWQTMPDRKFWTIAAGADNHDEPYGLGLAHSLYWPVFFKRNDVKFWLMFLEKFGMPTAVAKLPSGKMIDPTEVAKATAMLRQIATDAGVVVPEDVVVELLEAARSGSADYAGLHDAMNSAISKIVVGQTMTTDNGSSKSQAEVHAGVAQKIVEADSDLLCGAFNAGPVKWWTEWNFPGANPPKVYRNTEPAEDLTARAERDAKIYSLGFEPTEEYIAEHYGEGWKKREQAPAVMPGQAPGMQGGGRANPGDADPEQFAEGEVAALAALKAARRGDQQSLADAARYFAEQYQTVTGRRIGQILRAAEFSEDYETMRRRLDELIAEAPPEETQRTLSRSGFFANLLGAFRAQR